MDSLSSNNSRMKCNGTVESAQVWANHQLHLCQFSALSNSSLPGDLPYITALSATDNRYNPLGLLRE